MSSLIRWQPLREIQALRQQVDHLFDTLVHGEPLTDLLPKVGDMTWTPAIELQETETAILLKAEVPGIPVEELNVEVGENTVTISGEHREESKAEEKGMVRSELRYGKFYRMVPLPAAVKNEAVKAEFKDGMLMLTMPKVEASRRNVVKVDLGLQEKMREAVTEDRLKAEQREETVHRRAAEAMAQPNGGQMTEEAREAVVGDRQKETHLEETTHRRAADSIGAPV
ncbi:MAG: heat-shock protein Hsp20 [Alkalinema sp. CACIAM 70d]|nr:MAG: heat-shock protein Hsp20 [Alkalinema sp. CACIAM 70d]